MKKKPTEPNNLGPVAKKSAVPTVTIYQNPDHVSGILQQLYREPLATAGTLENVTTNETSTSTGIDGGVDVTGQVGFFSNKATIAGKVAAAADNQNKASGSGKRTSVMEYTQAFYLHVVREFLRDSGQLHTVSSLADAQNLQVGDIVEYSAVFTPDRMTVFLDVLTPDLIAAIVERNIRSTAIEGIDWSNFEQRNEVLEKTRHKIEMQTDLARAVTHAVRTDFRSDKTREFFAEISESTDVPPVTAITICDNVNFTVDDTDRILDGRFTVLGKVSETLATDRPTLERNKLLSSIPPESVDALIEEMHEQLAGTLERARLTGEVAFDPGLTARVPGQSFKVIPIAIYI